MSKFATKQITLIKARERVDQLLIDGIGQLDAFEESLIGTTFKSELNTLLRYIEHFANGNSIGERLEYLKGVKDGIVEYEFRSKHLRIYAIQPRNNKLIVFCGIKHKANSMDNIQPFRAIKKRFLESLK